MTAPIAASESNSRFIAVVACSFIGAFIGSLLLIRLLLFIYRLMGRAIWGAPIAASNGEGCLSAEKKKAIDDLRSSAIRRHLQNFTVTLSSENDTDAASTEQSESQQSTTTAAAAASTTGVENKKDSNDECEEIEEMKVDIDEELANNNNENDDDGTEQEQVFTEKCTLLASAPDNMGSVSIDTTITPTCEGRGTKNTANSSAIQYEKLECMDIHSNTHDEDHNNENVICAICHEGYTPSDTLCKASNSECSHVFHQECIVHWLVSLGWTKLKEKHVKENMLSDAKLLLDYELECPCCRRDFIDRELFDVLDGKGEAVEEKGVDGADNSV